MRSVLCAPVVLMACSSPVTPPDRCSGVADASIVVANTGAVPADLALDEQFVYWTSFGDNVIYRARKTGGSPEPLAADDAPQFIAVDSANAYWVNGEGQLSRVPKTGGPVDVLSAGIGCGNLYPCAVAIADDNDALYWAEEGHPARVFRFSKSDSITTSADVVGLATQNLVVDADYVYFGVQIYDGMLHSGVGRLPKLGGSSQQLTMFDEPTIGGIAVDGNYVYVARTGGIWRLNKDGTDLAQISDVTNGRRLVTNATTVYATTSTTVERVEHDGTDAAPIACKQASATSLALDSTSVFWLDADRETISFAPLN